MVNLGADEFAFVREEARSSDRFHSDFVRRLVLTHPDFLAWREERDTRNCTPRATYEALDRGVPALKNHKGSNV